MPLTKLNTQSATSLDATVLTGNLPAISGASLTGISSKILKVYNDYDSGDIGTSSNSLQDSGLSITLTPTATSSDFYLIADMGTQHHHNVTASFVVKLLRDTTELRHFNSGYEGYLNQTHDRGYAPSLYHYIDQPNTTSSITYKIQYRSESNGSTVNSLKGRQLTIFEIAGIE